MCETLEKLRNLKPIYYNKRKDPRFIKDDYLKAFQLPKDPITLTLTPEYIKSKADFDMNNQQHRMIGNAAEKKFLEMLGEDYIEGIKYKTDYFKLFNDSKIPMELKTTMNTNFTSSENEWSVHHPMINPYYIFAVMNHISGADYNFHICNIVLFSDFAKKLYPSQYNNSKFISITDIEAFE